jgi:hypothetical protein
VSEKPRGRARERHERRRDSVVKQRTTTTRQITPPRSVSLPKINFTGVRWALFLVLAVVVMMGVLAISGLINPPEEDTHPHGIWLNEQWTHGKRSAEDIAVLAQTLQANDVGLVFAYVSSMLEDQTWAGSSGNSRFNEVEADIVEFVRQLKAADPELIVYAWIEVQADTPQGYRLNSPQVQRIVADLSQRTIESMGFDGVFLDVKPIFDGNPDFPTLLQAVSRAIGVETPLAVAIPPDLTPTDAQITLPAQIAPNTIWNAAYKQRIALLVDLLVVTAYNSYLTDPVDYINWVSYQVKSYLGALNGLQTTTRLMISLPNYQDLLPAHDADIETLPAALDGVQRALATILPEDQLLFQGVAIFADRELTTEDWRIFREKWQE